MHIAICDDEISIQQSLSKLLRLAYDENDLAWDEPHCFDDAESLLNALQQGKRFDLFYLDIEMPGQSGMEAAAYIRAQDRQAQIIFITSHSEQVYDVFQVAPLDFLKKPLDCQRFLKAFQRFLENYRWQHQHVLCQTEGGLITFPVADILYLSTKGRQMELRLANGQTHLIQQGINELTTSLKLHHILRCHRSYLVNLAYVNAITMRQQFTFKSRTADKDALLFDPQHTDAPIRIPIGRSYLNDFQEAFIHYQTEGGFIF